MRVSRRLWIGPVVLLVATSLTLVSADPPPAAPPAVQCRWADTPIAIDGRPDDPAWKHAQLIERFVLPWLGAAARPARAATRGKLLWDREYLYIFADMDDDALVGNDALALFARPAVDKPGYFEVRINAAGAVFARFH